MTDHEAAIRAAVQAMLDAEGDGYQVAQLVIALGLERISPDGVQSAAWTWAPPEQPDWQTVALLHEAIDIQQSRVESD